MTELRAAGYLLRPFKADDAPAFAAAVRESRSTVGAWLPWAQADFSEDDALAWFAHCDDSRADSSAYEFGIFLADGRGLIGGAGLNQFNTSHGFCNLGYWVRESAQRRGAALAAIGALARYAFGMLRQSRVEIVVLEHNEASMALARKAGAVHECLARNRVLLQGKPVAAHVYALLPPPSAR